MATRTSADAFFVFALLSSGSSSPEDIFFEMWTDMENHWNTEWVGEERGFYFEN